MLEPCMIAIESATTRCNHSMPSVNNDINNISNKSGHRKNTKAIKNMQIALGDMKVQLAMSDIAVCLDILDDFNNNEPLLEFSPPGVSVVKKVSSSSTPQSVVRNCVDVHSKSFGCLLIDDMTPNHRIELAHAVMHDLCYSRDDGYTKLHNHQSSLPPDGMATPPNKNEKLGTLLGNGVYTSIAVKDMHLYDMRAPQDYRTVFGTSLSSHTTTPPPPPTTNNISQTDGTKPLTKFELLQLAGSEQKIINWQFHVIEVAWHPAFVAKLHSCIRSIKQAQKEKIQYSGLASPQLTRSSSLTSTASSTTTNATTSSFHIRQQSTTTTTSSSSASTPSSKDSHHRTTTIISSAAEGGKIMLDVTVGISAIKFRLDKEMEERSLLCFTMKEMACRFRRSLSDAQHQSQKEELGAWLEGSIGAIHVEDVCSTHTLYRDMISTHRSSLSSLARFSYKNAVMLANHHNSKASSSNENKDREVDEEEVGIEEGCNLLSLSLSSMKFVYLQQFWLEIVDYVSEGILGDAVNGTLRSASDWMAQQVATKTAIKVNT
jgi:hypothetical protein